MWENSVSCNLGPIFIVSAKITALLKKKSYFDLTATFTANIKGALSFGFYHKIKWVDDHHDNFIFNNIYPRS